MSRSGQIVRALMLAGVLLVAVACGERAPTVTSVTLPSGWQTIRQTGLVFALPPAWEVISAEDGNFEGALDELEQSNPRLSAVAAQGRQALTSGQVELMAFDLTPENALPNFTTNLSVGQQRLERLASLEEVANANVQVLEQNGFEGVKHTISRIGAYDMVWLNSTLQITAVDAEPLQLAIDQYIVQQGQQQHVLTFTTTATEHERLRPLFEQIMGTVQLSE